MPARKQDTAALPAPGEEAAPGITNRTIADTLLTLPDDIRQVWREGRLVELPNVGVAIAGKIVELLRTGRLGFYERLAAEIPPSLLEITAVPEIGPKTAMTLYQSLGVRSLADLQAAIAKSGPRWLKYAPWPMNCCAPCAPAACLSTGWTPPAASAAARPPSATSTLWRPAPTPPPWSISSPACRWSRPSSPTGRTNPPSGCAPACKWT